MTNQFFLSATGWSRGSWVSIFDSLKVPVNCDAVGRNAFVPLMVSTSKRAESPQLSMCDRS